MESSLTHLLPVLQTAIGPVILISGVGLLLLSMTNRLGRAIDRSRILSRELAQASGENRGKITRQLQVLWRRARLIRLSILLASNSVLLAAVLIITLFLAAWMKADCGVLIGVLFIACLLCLIGSLAYFTHDITLSLHALKVELTDEGVSES